MNYLINTCQIILILFFTQCSATSKKIEETDESDSVECNNSERGCDLDNNIECDHNSLSDCDVSIDSKLNNETDIIENEDIIEVIKDNETTTTTVKTEICTNQRNRSPEEILDLQELKIYSDENLDLIKANETTKMASTIKFRDNQSNINSEEGLDLKETKCNHEGELNIDSNEIIVDVKANNEMINVTSTTKYRNNQSNRSSEEGLDLEETISDREEEVKMDSDKIIEEFKANETPTTNSITEFVKNQKYRSSEESLDLPDTKSNPGLQNKKETDIIIDVKANGTTMTAIKTEVRENQSNRSSEESLDLHEVKSTLIDYPFAVSVQKRGAHYVSGALVNKQWILTVAADFFNVRESIKLFRGRLGSVNCKRGGTLVPIKKIEIHPYYVYGKPNFDVALLRMASPVAFNDIIRPIVISSVKGRLINGKFIVTYWPRLLLKDHILPQTAKERITPNTMRVSKQTLLPTESCMDVMKSLVEELNESSLCLEPIVTLHSPCMPDAGAPVVAEDGLWGITSGWTPPTCLQSPAPTIFTRLSSPSIRSWLDTQLNIE